MAVKRKKYVNLAAKHAAERQRREKAQTRIASEIFETGVKHFIAKPTAELTSLNFGEVQKFGEKGIQSAIDRMEKTLQSRIRRMTSQQRIALPDFVKDRKKGSPEQQFKLLKKSLLSPKANLTGINATAKKYAKTLNISVEQATAISGLTSDQWRFIQMKMVGANLSSNQAIALYATLEAEGASKQAIENAFNILEQQRMEDGLRENAQDFDELWEEMGFNN